jgi:hypothetical protein
MPSDLNESMVSVRESFYFDKSKVKRDELDSKLNFEKKYSQIIGILSEL